MRILLPLLLLLVLGSCGQPSDRMLADVEPLRLPNGMTFLLLQHGETPIFSGYVRVRVGGMDEPSGQTGLAHVIEHMAFKGTKRWGTNNWEAEQKLLATIEVVGQKLAAEYAKPAPVEATLQQLKEELRALYEQHKIYLKREEITREIQRRGGLNFNATTSQDLTSYFVSLPSSELQFWAELESERIFQPIFREFYLERDVVLEERRSRLIDNPFGALYTELMRAAFPNSPYGIPTIGEERDLLTLTRTKAEEFFQKHYRPDQAVGAIVGRFSKRKLKKLLSQTFGQIPKPETAVPQTVQQISAPPYEREGCRVDLVRPAQERLMVVYHKPALPDPADYVFDVISTLLTADRSTRLYRDLVVEKGLAVSVDSYAASPGSRLPNLFMIMVVPRPGVPLNRLLEEIEVHIARLTTRLVSDEELRNAQKQLIDHQVWQFEQNDKIAAELSYFQAIAGDWRYIVQYPEAIRLVSAREIQQTALRYLTPGNRCLAFLHFGAGEKE